MAARRLKGGGRFLLTVATLPKIIRGCVVISSGEERAGTTSAVGQTPAVHGVARAGVEHPRRGPRGRVSRTTGNNWSRGYKTYRHGEVTGFVPALDRLAVREISARYLSQDERIETADLRHAGLNIRQIADPGPGTVDDLPRIAPRRGRQRDLPAVRGASPSDRPPGPPSPVGDQPRELRTC
jgi:hypothetical protein